MTIGAIADLLERIAPLQYQEGYDNSGLIIGEKSREATGVLFALDALPTVMEEAKELGCNLVVVHHPIVFKGLKKINRKNYVERVVWYAIQNDIAIYACHTNLDNVLQNGVNGRIADKLGLTDTHILVPRNNMERVFIDLEADEVERIRDFLKKELDDCELFVRRRGVTVTCAEPGARRVKRFCEQQGWFFISHSTNEANPHYGSGLVGRLEAPMSGADFLRYLKDKMDISCIRHTEVLQQGISRVAICGGAGSFLLGAAKAAGADAYVSADFKYHEFFDADGEIMICDIGHYESEQYTIELLYEIVTENFPNFAAYKTKAVTNPIKYY